MRTPTAARRAARVRETREPRLDVLVDRARTSGERIEHVMLDGLAQLMALDEERHEEWRVAVAFTGRAVDDPRLGEVRVATLGRNGRPPERGLHRNVPTARPGSG